MVKVDIEKEEISALKKLYDKSEVPVVEGFLLGSLMRKIILAVNAENEKSLKEKYSPKDRK